VYVCAPFTWGSDGTGITVGRRQASGGSVMIWETLGSCWTQNMETWQWLFQQDKAP